MRPDKVRALTVASGDAGDNRVPPPLLAQMQRVWDEGMAYAR